MEIFSLDLPGLLADGLVSCCHGGEEAGCFLPAAVMYRGADIAGGMSRNRTRSKHDIIEHDLSERAESRSQVTVGGRGDCQTGQEPMAS